MLSWNRRVIKKGAFDVVCGEKDVSVLYREILQLN